MLNATLSKKVKITDTLIIVEVKPDEPIPDFLPGQYVALGLFPEAPRPEDYPPIENSAAKPGKIIRRTYSIASTPERKDVYEFYLAIVPTGDLTSRLIMLEEGDRLYVAPKVTGKFTLSDVPDDANLIFISTGTGIAPYISMLRTSGLWQTERKISLIQGVRYKEDFAYNEELYNLEKENPNFKYYATVSREDWGGDRGYVQQYFENELIKPDIEKDHLFLCGNPAMVDDLEKRFVDQGFKVHSTREPGNLHLEKYW